MQIKIKRAYAPIAAEDGFRLLVDRLWPRGLSKQRLQLDAWIKELTPSSGLRKWFAHDPERLQEFRRCYLAELDAHREVAASLLQQVQGAVLTLIYAARDEHCNHALVLKDFLDQLGEELEL